MKTCTAAVLLLHYVHCIIYVVHVRIVSCSTFHVFTWFCVHDELLYDVVSSQRRVGVVWMFLFYPGLDRRRFGDVCAARVSDSYHIMLPAAMMGVTFWSVVVLGLMMPV